MSNQRERVPYLAPKFPLRVLLVEDNAVDAELCVEFLSVAQFEVTADVVQTPAEFVDKLRTGSYDIVIADYNLGSWTGMDALDALQNESSDLPFILLTAALGDATAVECMKRGLTDYVLKDRMERLPVAIYRAMEQRASRNEKLVAKRTAQEADAKFQALADISQEAIFIEQGGRCTYVNKAAETVTGFRRSELVQMTFWQLIPEKLRRNVLSQTRRQGDAQPIRCQTQVKTRSGAECWIECTVKVLQIDGRIATIIAATAIAKPAEEPSVAEEQAFIELSERVSSVISMPQFAHAV